VKHGCAQKNKKTSEYQIWVEMRQRCNNPKHLAYHNYGGRGIKVCKYWNNFENFLASMGSRPPDLTLDRIENSGNYEPANCQWATRKEQAANTRKLKRFCVLSPCKEKTVHNNQHEFARQHGLDPAHISACLCGKRKQHKGWTFLWL
jgi:hypothetical protein